MFSGLPVFTSSRRPARPGLRFLAFILPLLLTALAVVRPARSGLRFLTFVLPLLLTTLAVVRPALTQELPTISINSPSVAEGDSGSTNLTFTATLNEASAEQVTVDWGSGTGGTATAGTDYTAITGGALTFAAGTTSQDITVSVTGDTLDEVDETVVVTLSNAANATIGTATGTGTITDNDDAPSLSINSPSVTEGDSSSTNLTFTVKLSAASGKQVTVDWGSGTGGTATAGTDYTAISGGTLTFAAGTTSQTFNVSVTGDALDEADETIVVTLSNAANATIGTATGTGTITDNDDAPSLSINSPSVTEGDSGSTNLTFTVKLSAASGKQVTVDWGSGTGGTATAGTDYTAISGGTLTFAAGTTSQTFNVSVTGDTLDEADETIVVTLSNAANATIGTATGTGTITDNDDAPSLSINSPSVTEGDSGSTNLTFTVKLSAASGKQVTVDWGSGTGGTATAGTDYTAISGGTLTFAAGTTSQTFNVSVTGDTLDEADESVVVALSGAVNATISTATGTGTITDNDPAPTVTLSVADASISENGGSTTVSAMLSHASSEATTITISPVANAYTVGSDATIAIAAGETENSSDTATINAVDNDTGEADRSVTVIGSASNARGIGQVTGASLTLEDDDGGAGPTDEGDDGGAGPTDEGDGGGGPTGEGDGGGGPTGEGDGGGGPTDEGDDGGAGPTGEGDDGGGPTGEGDDGGGPTGEGEGDDGGGPTGEGEGEGGDGPTGSQDSVPTVSIDSPSVTEGDSGSKNLTFTLTLSAASTERVRVRFSDKGTGTATAGTDYPAFPLKWVRFQPGELTKTVSISVTGDTVKEPNETIIVDLLYPLYATIATPTGTGTITDDDTTPGLSISSQRVTEGDSGSKNLTYTVSLTAASTQQVTVDYADAGTGTATSGTDYTAITGGTLTFAVGATSQTFNVSVTGDTDVEPHETVVVSLSNASGATISTATGTGTIVNDDGSSSLSVSSLSVVEADTTIRFTVSLSTARSESARVTWWDTEEGTATAGQDYGETGYNSPGRTWLTFAPGEISKTTNLIYVRSDGLEETDETIIVAASEAADGAGRVTGTATIKDDDGPALSIDSPSVTEGDSGSKNLTFTVTLNKASTQQVTVDWGSGTGGTATSGTDYTAITGGALTFAAGTTSQTFNVSVTGDTTDEADETVVVTLSNAANATIATATGTGTITDNDDAPTLSIDSPRVTEGDSGSTNLTFTATLSAASGKQVTVDWGSGTGGTATSGTDYTAITGGALTFAVGTTSQTFNVSVTGDTTVEPHETVVVTLSNGVNATISMATGTGTIVNDDGVIVSINSPSVTEGDSGSTNLTFTATLNKASTQQVEVDWGSGTGGTATSGTDYTAITGGTLTFAVGTTSQTFDVSVTGDTLDEADETVVVTLSNAANATIGTATGTGTITDNDDAPTLSINSPRVTEGDSGSKNLTFTVTLSAASGKQVTVDWGSGTGGTATSGTDYTAITGGALTFAVGTTSQTFNVSVTGDTDEEQNETVVAMLSNAANATISTATGTGDDCQRRRRYRLHQLAERDRGGQRLEEPDVHGDPEQGQYPAGDGELRRRRNRDSHVRDGLHDDYRRRSDLRGGYHQPDLRRVGDRRHRRGGGRDRHSDPERRDERDDLDGDRHGDDHGQRRDAVAVDQLAERDRGGQRLEEPDVHGDPEQGQYPAGDGGLRGRGDRHSHVRDGLHDDHRRRSDLRGGRHQPDLQRVGDGRHDRRGKRDHPGDPEQCGERDDLDRDRNRDDHGQRRRAVAVDQLAERDRGGQRLEEPDVHGDVERGERQAGDGGLGVRDGRHGHVRDGLHGHYRRRSDLRGGYHQPDLRRVGDRRH